tara:strand:+ start:1115 stop:1294 length:180 start_codon:yes stop_codon:yes gene_type:complete
MALYSWFNRNQSTFSSISEQQETKTIVNKPTSEKTQTTWVITSGNKTLTKDTPNTQLTN